MFQPEDFIYMDEDGNELKLTAQEKAALWNSDTVQLLDGQIVAESSRNGELVKACSDSGEAADWQMVTLGDDTNNAGEIVYQQLDMTDNVPNSGAQPVTVQPSNNDGMVYEQSVQDSQLQLLVNSESQNLQQVHTEYIQMGTAAPMLQSVAMDTNVQLKQVDTAQIQQNVQMDTAQIQQTQKNTVQNRQESRTKKQMHSDVVQLIRHTETKDSHEATNSVPYSDIPMPGVDISGQSSNMQSQSQGAKEKITTKHNKDALRKIQEMQELEKVKMPAGKGAQLYNKNASKAATDKGPKSHDKEEYVYRTSTVAEIVGSPPSAKVNPKDVQICVGRYLYCIVFILYLFVVFT